MPIDFRPLPPVPQHRPKEIEDAVMVDLNVQHKIRIHKESIVMKISKSSLVLTAAFTGLLGGTMARAAALANPGAISPIAGQAAADKVEKHACKGLNSCKGKGGCSSSDNGCKGKNSCKGKGGCATDGSKK